MQTLTGRPVSGSPSSQGRICSTCALSIAGSTTCIKCSICTKFFHANLTCAGVQANAIKAVSQHLGHQGAFAYRCIKCRVSPAASGTAGSNPDLAGAIGQLSDMFNGLVATVTGLANKVDTLASGRPASALQNPMVSIPPGTNAASLDPQLIRSELREIFEQDRRSDSIIIRGIATPVNNSQSNADFLNLFNAAVAELLPGKAVTLTDFVVIKKELARAKITDPLLRRDLLSVARNLRTSAQFNTIFISRDLTYSQRGVGKARRDAAKARLAAQQRDLPLTSTTVPPIQSVPATTPASQSVQPNLVQSAGPTPLSASATLPGPFFR